MKKSGLLFILFTLLTGLALQAQETRFLDMVFAKNEIKVTKNITYATNITVLTGAPAPEQLRMDVYEPIEDSPNARPLVLVFHTGSFLPPLFNGGATGSRGDSAVVEVCTRLARMGYVTAAVSNRLGWNPVSTDENVRRGTLLNAAYRGVQDARACVRYFRKDVAENNNAFNIDADKITAFGLGTGGYITHGAGYLGRDNEEIGSLDKFINSSTLIPYVVPQINGNVFGTDTAAINLPNHASYDSDIALVVNCGGAMGDISWMEGKEGEPPVMAFHVVSDPFAPYADGAVIVPTTREFVVNVSGSYSVVKKANDEGLNDVFDAVNNGTDPLTLKVKAENLYPFLRPGFQAGPWDWYDLNTLRLIVAGTNAALGTTFNADTIHRNSLLTNPQMSPASGKAVIDTMIAFFAPRAYAALELEGFSGVPILSQADVQLTMAPNPASESVMFKTAMDKPILDLHVYDMAGRLVQSHANIKRSYYELDRNGLSRGMYVVRLRFESGLMLQKLLFD